MSNLWDCEYYNRCLKNDKCLTCGPEQRLLTLPEDKQRKDSRSKVKSTAITAIDDNSGKTLEDYVRDRFNSLPTVKEWMARRQIGSGNIWFMPGDVADTVILAECKERYKITAKGEKTISITKTMLEKIDAEAKSQAKYPALPFRFKGDESAKTYFIQDFEVLCEMVHELKFLRHENKVVTNERDMYKKISEELFQEVQRLKAKAGEE